MEHAPINRDTRKFAKRAFQCISGRKIMSIEMTVDTLWVAVDLEREDD